MASWACSRCIMPNSDAFTKDHAVRILLAISSKIGLSIARTRCGSAVPSPPPRPTIWTNLPNARSLFLQLDAELSRGRRMELPLVVAVLDLDGFKQVNDRFGHLEGNKVLKAVAAGLKSICREYDYVARMGGDEFVVLLPGVKPGDVDVKLTQFRSVVREIGSEMFPGSSLTVSMGVAHFPLDGNDAEQLLAEADRRMYKEKHAQKQAITQKPAWAEGWTSVVQ